jgi:transcriptional regulator with XRE-family HTH domain
MNEILQAFKTRRNELGVTQTEMAKRLNISQSQYQKIESGGNPSLKTLTSMAMALNMKLLLVPSEKSTEINQLIKPPARAKRLKTLLEQFEVKENE